MEIVTGYKGQNDLYIAMERGEIQANSSGLSTLTVSRPHLLKEKKVRILLQYGDERHPLLKDIPTELEVVQSEADRELWRFYTMKYAFARPLALPPDVPADRVKAIRDAFDATMKDAQYIADAKRIRLDVNPLSGEAIAKLVARINATPQPEVDRLRQMLQPPKN
jgi:tripartite-type tricarboxylate transporter receptor subunit TctC